MEVLINGVVCNNLEQLGNSINALNNSYNPGNGQEIFNTYRKAVGKLAVQLVKSEEKADALDALSTSLIAQRNEAQNAQADAEAELNNAKADCDIHKFERIKAETESADAHSELDMARGQIVRQAIMIERLNASINTRLGLAEHSQLEMAGLYKELEQEKELNKALTAQVKHLSQPTTVNTIAAGPAIPWLASERMDFIEGATAYFDNRKISIRKHTRRPHFLVKITNGETETKFVLTAEALAIFQRVAAHACDIAN